MVVIIVVGIIGEVVSGIGFGKVVTIENLQIFFPLIL